MAKPVDRRKLQQALTEHEVAPEQAAGVLAEVFGEEIDGVVEGLATKEDLLAVKVDLQAELSAATGELRGEIAEAKTELRGEIAEVAAEITAKVGTAIVQVDKKIDQVDRKLDLVDPKIGQANAALQAEIVQVDRKVDAVNADLGRKIEVGFAEMKALLAERDRDQAEREARAMERANRNMRFIVAATLGGLTIATAIISIVTAVT